MTRAGEQGSARLACLRLLSHGRVCVSVYSRSVCACTDDEGECEGEGKRERERGRKEVDAHVDSR